MSSFEPSSYQKAILEEIRNTQNNILVNAKAGSGKTSTLELIAEEIQKRNEKSLFLAFNKNIVDELTKRIGNPLTTISTIHAMGRGIITNYLNTTYGKNQFVMGQLSSKHTTNIIKLHFDKICGEDFANCREVKVLEGNKLNISKLKWSLICTIKNFCDYLRFYDIRNLDDKKSIEQIINLFNLDILREENLRRYGLDNYIQLVRATLNTIVYNFKNPMTDNNGKYVINLDFSELIWLPVFLDMPIPYWYYNIKYLLVDEAQDLNKIEHQLLMKFKSVNPLMRYIFVGDEFQAIYGFAGADTHSISNIKELFKTKNLPLNICYRCPEKVIKLAQTIVPEIESNPAREDKGKVYFIDYNLMHTLIKPGDMVISRTNADLLKAFKYFAIDNKYPVKFLNTALVNSVINELDFAINEFILRYKLSKPICEKIKNKLKTNPAMKKMFGEKIMSKFNTACKLVDKQVSETSLDIITDAVIIYNSLFYFGKVYKQFFCIKDDNGDNIEYFDQLLDEDGEVLVDFINYFKFSIYNIEDFTDTLSRFLKANDYKDVPILSTIHKMKGGEADNIFIYQYPRLPLKWSNMTIEQSQQEINLKYVAITRAKKSLYLCKLRPDRNDDDKNLRIMEQNEECLEKLKQLDILSEI